MYTGKRALQLISGETKIVTIRSLLFSSVRAPITAGTLQPKPSNRGMNDFPCKPTARMTRSMTNAARAIYPVSSSSAMPKNNSKMLGKNVSTLPTPPMIPSTNSDLNSPSARFADTKSLNHLTASSIQPCGISPTVNTTLNNSHMIPKNKGNPSTRCVSTRSIRSDTVCSWRPLESTNSATMSATTR